MKKTIIIFITLFGVLDRSSYVVSEVKPTGDYDVHKKIISIPGAPGGTVPYNPAIQLSNMLYLSGQLGYDPVTRQLVSDDVRNQTQQIFRNIRTLLHAAGSDMSQIVQCLVLLVDINDFQSMNEIYASAFLSANDYPTRTTFAVNALAANAKIEIQCTAYTQWHSSKQTLPNGCERLSFSSIFVLVGLIFYIVLQ